MMQIKRYTICLLLPCVSLAGFTHTGLHTVVTNSGLIIGSEVTYKGTTVNKYLGIPYAQPPIGSLRFQRTKPVKPWIVPLKAHSLPPSCWQCFPYAYPWADTLPGHSENCLYLNIWAPKRDISKRSLKAVMVWVHGGGFATGSNRLYLYDGHVFSAEGDVVIVYVNYRLDIFGFLSTTTDSEDAPGNMGLYDVLEALNWVNKNIEAFGGDKKKVTLFGQSAGSYTSAYFTVSPLTKGLFYQVILQSGAQDGYVSEGGDTRQQNQDIGQKVAKALNCSTDSITIQNSPSKVVNCLRKKGAKDIISTVRSVSPSIQNFLPVYADALMPRTLFEAVKLGLTHDVKIMVGNVQDEASIGLGAFYPDVFGPFGEKDPNVNKTYAKFIIQDTLDTLNGSDEIADHFLEGVQENDYETARRKAYYATGDFISFCPPLYYAEMLSDQQHDVYYFYYNHQTANTVFAPWTGVTHTIEVPFVFGRPLDSENYTSAEADFSESLIRDWTTFAKSGKPSNTWKKFTRKDANAKILRIDKNYPNYIEEHFSNCKYLRDYYNI